MTKIIYINGPSFSGKSWLNYRITEFLSHINIHFKNVCFEQCYKMQNPENYFYKIIEEKSDLNSVVIAESVQSNQHRKDSAIAISCFPSYEKHLDNYFACINKFGKEYVDSRVFGYSIGKIRNAFNRDYKVINNSYTFNGKNLDDILKVVKYYAIK